MNPKTPITKKNWSTVKVHKPLSSHIRQDITLPPAEIPSSFLAPLPPDGIADGLLKASVQNDDIVITMYSDPASFPGDLYILELNGTPLGSPYPFDPADGPTFEMTLSASDRVQGIHTLQYWYDATVGGQKFYSEPLPVIVDLTAAGAPETLPRLEDFDPRILSQGLSLDLLSELGDKVEATLGAYGGSADFSKPAPGDIVIPYIGSEPGDPITLSKEDLAAANITITFTKTHIDKIDDGQHDFYYTITDRAGNISPPSYTQEITLIVKSGIDDFAAPIIDAAGSSSGDIILEGEARAGVAVTIPGHPDLLPGDHVIVVWGDNEQAPGIVPGPDTDFDVTVEWLAISAKGSGDFDVSYYVTRLGGRIGESPATSVKVELTIPGGPDPIPSTPENENLGSASVYGDVDDIENTITLDDSQAGAKAIIPWLLADGTTEYLKVGDVVTLIWNGTNVTPPRTIDNGDITAKVDLEILIDSTILLADSGNLPVSYSVARDVTGVPDFNSSFAPAQAVDVKSAEDAPGGTLPLGKSTLPDERYNAALDVYMMGPADSAGGTRIEIPHYLNKQAGDKISATFAATEGYTGTGADIPDSHWEQQDYIVPAGDEEANSTFLDLPEENLFAVTAQGHGRINYTVENSITKKPGIEIIVLIDNR